MNPRQMKQAMKKMGINQVDMPDAIAVIIRTKSKDIIIRNPSVSKVNMMGSWTYQVRGDEEERVIEPELEITEEDIKTVMEQTNCSKEEAKKVIEKNKGDLASSIMELSNK